MGARGRDPPPPQLTAATLCPSALFFLIKSRDRADAARNKSPTANSNKDNWAASARTLRAQDQRPSHHHPIADRVTEQLLCQAWTLQVVTHEMVTWLYQERKNGCGCSQPGQLHTPVSPGKSDQGLR